MVASILGLHHLIYLAAFAIHCVYMPKYIALAILCTPYKLNPCAWSGLMEYIINNGYIASAFSVVLLWCMDISLHDIMYWP